MVQSFTSRGASHCDRETFSFKPRDKNLAAASSNSQRRFYHFSDFDSRTISDLLDVIKMEPSQLKQYSNCHVKKTSYWSGSIIPQNDLSSSAKN